MRKLLSAIVKIAANDVRAKIPSACPVNDRAKAKSTAENFFKTKYFLEICDMLDIPADKIRTQVMLEKDKYDELPESEMDV